MAQPEANDVIARYNAAIAALTQRAIFAESRADAAEAALAESEARAAG